MISLGNLIQVKASVLEGISGYSGYSGQQGLSGTSGYSGVKGAQGTTGYSGISGYSGMTSYDAGTLETHPASYFATASGLSSHTNNTSNPHSVTAAQVGLSNVENKSSATIRSEITSGNVTTALGFTPENVSNKSTSVSTDGSSDTKYPSVKAVKDYADGLVVGLLDYRGAYDASGNVFPSTGGSGSGGAVLKGDMWIISVAGTLGGVAIQIGDSVIAATDSPGQTAGNWNTLNGNISYVPANAATTISTSAPLSGGGDLSTNRTLSISQATTSTNGYLSSTDWNTFNGKASTSGTLGQFAATTSSQLAGVISDETGSGSLVFNTSPTLSGVTLSDGTANGVLYLNGSKVATSGSALTFDGTNLGIGTASPVNQLTLSNSGGTNGILLDYAMSSSDYAEVRARYIGQNNCQSAVRFINPNNAFGGAITFWTQPESNGVAMSERMRIDTSGNLGLGVTPSAWITGYKAIQMPGGSIESHAGYIGMWGNCYLNSSAQYTYVSDGNASRYLQNSGYHFWFTAPSGTAGNTITFTQAMTLDANGNLGLGRTPSYRLHLISGGDTAINVMAADSTLRTTGLVLGGYSGTDGSTGGAAIKALTNFSGTYDSALLFCTTHSETVPTERMRLDTYGNLLVGTTSQSNNGKLEVSGYTVNTASFINNQSTSGYNGIYTAIQSTGNNTSTYHFKGQTYSTNAWYLYGNGTSSYSSDERLKKNIETTRDGYIDDIMKLRVVKYNWKSSEEGTPRELGMIAQEVEAVFPNLVQDDIAPLSEDDPTLYKQVKWSVLPFILTKALQEAVAKIDSQSKTIESLTQRIEALEAKGE